MVTKSLLLLALVIGYLPALLAQNVIPKLEIKAKEVYVVSAGDRLLIDTLIMHDQAKIKFEIPADTAYLAVNTAYIGKDCKVLASGKPGLNRISGSAGTPGQHGTNLVIDMHFARLGNLIIDTRGGAGDKGDEGRGEVRANKRTDGDGSYTSIAPHVAASAGSAGGNGGNGGSVFFTYSTEGFIPQFNQGRGPNAINIIFHGGKAGKPGWHSKQEGRAGADGQVRLINAITRN